MRILPLLLMLWTPISFAAVLVEANLDLQRVVDGDTIILGASAGTLTVRLAGIDAPELSQPYGKEAQATLAALVTGRDVKIKVEWQDRYKRILGRLYVGEMDVNSELVRSGMVWVYRQHNRDPQLLALEAEARAAQRGLWAKSEPVPPWEWRKRSNLRCDYRKRSCRDMENCEMAKFYLKECGMTALDNNGDGIPCDKLCN